MAKAITAVLIAIGIGATVACATTQGYHICNDFDANITCPDDTANVVVGM